MTDNEAIETIVVDVMLAEEVIINAEIADDSAEIDLLYDNVADVTYKGASVVNEGGVAIIPQQSKADVGLGNVDNTSDINKPVSTAQQTAIDTAVAGEAALRGSADQALQEAIDAEEEARAAADTALQNSKVDKIAGKGLSTNDYTTQEKEKLAGIDPSVLLTTSDKGVAGGVAELDSTGKVPSSQLPAYVDDVLEYDNRASFPSTGEAGKIYIAKDTNLTYRWSGSAYVIISPSLALGETSSTAYRGDRGAAAYAHISDTNNPHSVTKAQVGLGNVDNTADADKPISNLTQIALDALSTITNVSTVASTGTSGVTYYGIEVKRVGRIVQVNCAGIGINSSTSNLKIYTGFPTHNYGLDIVIPIISTSMSTSGYITIKSNGDMHITTNGSGVFNIQTTTYITNS